MNSRGADVLVDGGCHHQEITRQVYPSCLRLRQLLHLHQHFHLQRRQNLGDDPLQLCLLTPHQLHLLQLRQRCLHLEQSGIEPDLTLSIIFIYFFLCDDIMDRELFRLSLSHFRTLQVYLNRR